MAITSQERADLLELVVLMFDATPGARYLPNVVAVYEAAGHDLHQLATLLAGTSAFLGLHPNFELADEFASEFLATIGLENDAFARDWVVAQFNAGASKPDIVFATWAVLAGLPGNAPPQYLAAKATLEHKAQVSAYYAVTVGGDAESVEALQAVLRGVTEDGTTVAVALAAIDAAIAGGPQLTIAQDDIAVPGTGPVTVSGLIDGDADGNTEASTLTAGDSVSGNGATTLKLTVVEPGQTAFAQLAGIEQVLLVASTAGPLKLNAGGWTGVGSLALAGGMDGLEVFVDDLATDTAISVQDAVGSVTVLYDSGLFASVRNDVAGSAGASFQASAGGDITATVAGGATVAISIHAAMAIGDITVSGEGGFIVDGQPQDEVSIGNVDFSGYQNHALIDLRFTATGASAISSGAGDDEIWGNAGNNTFTAGAGVDILHLGEGGIDTVVTRAGDSGTATGTLDTVTGFAPGDLLDFDLAAGSAGNYVERADNFTTLAEFIANADEALGSAARYFVQDNGVDTYVAVDFGSGGADAIILLMGVADATSLQFQDFVA
ncbi:MAG: hypothetical protein HY854_02595 [Burkholderiales bacterium]|nr:hypothetical protein [Burkholderiales bacterium]